MSIFTFENVERVLSIGAHPDDETFIGALLHKFYRLNVEIYQITLSCGGTAAHSPEQIERMIADRTEEMKAVDEILGIRERIVFGYPCQEIAAFAQGGQRLVGTDGTEQPLMKDQLVKYIRKFRPNLILTHFPDSHYDHTPIACLTPKAASTASEELMDYLGAPWITDQIVNYPVEHEIPRPTIIAEVSKEDVEAQIKALRVNESQDRPGGYLDRFERKMCSRLGLWGSDPRVWKPDSSLDNCTYAQPLAVDNYRTTIVVE